jgi:hypothetical protein
MISFYCLFCVTCEASSSSVCFFLIMIFNATHFPTPKPPKHISHLSFSHFPFVFFQVSSYYECEIEHEWEKKNYGNGLSREPLNCEEICLFQCDHLHGFCVCRLFYSNMLFPFTLTCRMDEK